MEKKTDTTTLGFGVSETFTGQYLNSKPIYQKMIDVGALPNNTTKSISTGITGADYAWIDMENSFAFNSGASYPIPYVDPKTVANSIGVRITSNGATVAPLSPVAPLAPVSPFCPCGPVIPVAPERSVI